MRLIWALLLFFINYRPVIMGAGRRDYLVDQDTFLRDLAEKGGGYYYTREEADVLRRYHEAERLRRRAEAGMPDAARRVR